MKPTIINLTPHHVHVVGDNGTTIATFPPDGTIARVEISSYPTALSELLGVPCTHSHYREVTGLPDPVDGTWFLTSQIVANAVKDHRADVLHPGELVRDISGQPTGCKSLNSL